MKKENSLGESFRIKTVEEMQELLPARIEAANEVLCLDTDDDVMTVLRHYDWSQSKLNDKWFNEMDTV